MMTRYQLLNKIEDELKKLRTLTTLETDKEKQSQDIKEIKETLSYLVNSHTYHWTGSREEEKKEVLQLKNKLITYHSNNNINYDQKQIIGNIIEKLDMYYKSSISHKPLDHSSFASAITQFNSQTLAVSKKTNMKQNDKAEIGTNAKKTH